MKILFGSDACKVGAVVLFMANIESFALQAAGWVFFTRTRQMFSTKAHLECNIANSIAVFYNVRMCCFIDSFLYLTLL